MRGIYNLRKSRSPLGISLGTRSNLPRQIGARKARLAGKARKTGCVDLVCPVYLVCSVYLVIRMSSFNQ